MVIDMQLLRVKSVNINRRICIEFECSPTSRRCLEYSFNIFSGSCHAYATQGHIVRTVDLVGIPASNLPNISPNIPNIKIIH